MPSVIERERSNHLMEHLLHLGPAGFIGAGCQGVELTVISHNCGQFMTVPFREMDLELQVVEGAAQIFPLTGFDQLSFTAAARWCNHGATQLFTHRHNAAEILQTLISINRSNHQAEGFVTVDQIVEHHLGAIADGHPAPTGRIEEGITAIGAAEALQTRINQIVDPATGDTIGGVTVSYSSESNSFTFSTGTTGTDSTIKVKGASRLGLDDVPLGVGSVPEIYNLVQATNADGAALYVDANGEVVTNPPANMVEGYYPLYIDEGELTFDKTGKLLSPKNLVHYEKQEEGFSISLDVDFSTSTQLAQPFSVLTVEQDGFTSGRLDGIEIDSSGTIRANYTNGQNNPLGKIVVANFNNQNGLKQIGNATYTETAVSGTPQVGEAGSEGFGNILSGSLERSNVDITEELVNLITAQRNFQASAKAIETTTGLTQTIINIRM